MSMRNSVVLLEEPTRTSWATEALLVPWVHYVPINQTNMIAEPVQWVKDHDSEAEQIAQRATLFMYDMLYHPDAGSDEEKIQSEMVRRCTELWRNDP